MKKEAKLDKQDRQQVFLDNLKQRAAEAEDPYLSVSVSQLREMAHALDIEPSQGALRTMQLPGYILGIGRGRISQMHDLGDLKVLLDNAFRSMDQHTI